MIRLLFWVLLSPLRLLRWVVRRLHVATVGYDVLRLKIHGHLPDRPHVRGILASLSPPRGPSLLPTLALLERARRDPRLKAVLVELGPLSAGLGRAEELAAAFQQVSDAGKTVVVFMEQAGLVEYRAALGAGRIVLAPSGSLDVTGVASEVTFFKGLLDKVGLRATLAARGKYKSARETFTESDMSEGNREMTESLVGDLYEQLVGAIAAARGFDPARVREALDEGPFLAERAVQLGLADQQAYLDDVEKTLEESLGRFRVLGPEQYAALAPRRGSGRPTRIALLEVGGHIKSGRSVVGPNGPRATGSRTFVEQVEAVAKDRRVRGVVLRVDSPGGSALASDVMWHALGQLGERPVVVSMANVAASGGYFVSGLKGATVLASDATITGSIGVLGGKFDARGLYDKLGVNKAVVRRGAHASWASDYVPFSDEELSKLEGDIDAHYRDFVQKMAEGRGVTYEQLHAVAQGRVWTGRQARDKGLVDEPGGLMSAFDVMRGRLELPETARFAVITPRTERSNFDLRSFLGGSLDSFGMGAAQDLLGSELASAMLGRSLWHERILAVLPFHLDFR